MLDVGSLSEGYGRLSGECGEAVWKLWKDYPGVWRGCLECVAKLSGERL